MPKRRTSSRLPTIKPEAPHGALGEIREIPPYRKSQRDVPVPKSERPYKPTQKK
jgi:hypothetical protein